MQGLIMSPTGRRKTKSIMRTIDVHALKGNFLTAAATLPFLRNHLAGIPCSVQYQWTLNQFQDWK